jgi:hypothetical protein
MYICMKAILVARDNGYAVITNVHIVISVLCCIFLCAHLYIYTRIGASSDLSLEMARLLYLDGFNLVLISNPGDKLEDFKTQLLGIFLYIHINACMFMEMQVYAHI